MFQQLGIPILGVVENMSYFVGDDGKEYDIFGRGGAEVMAQTMGLPYLGGMPIHMNLRTNCDAGNPLANWDTPALGRDIDALCQRLASQISIQSHGGLIQPTLSVR
jgi:ATP-binding protein involved in chromosome partitioning